MPFRIAVQHTDRRRIFVVNFGLQVMHSDILYVPMKNGNQNPLDTRQENKSLDISTFKSENRF